MCSEYTVINSSARTFAQNVQRSKFIGLDMCSVFMLKEKVVIIGILMFSYLNKKTIIIAILMFSNLSQKLTSGTTIQSNTDYRSRGTKTKSKVGRGEGVPFIP